MKHTQRPIGILHLEDNPRDAQLIRDQLEADGLVCEITLVTGRQSFESALDQCAFDVIFCDHNLPDYDGFSALAQAKAKQSGAPVILISGSLGDEDAVKGLHQGACDYLLKGRLERLPSAVKRALAEAEEHRKRQQAEAALRESEERFRDLFENAHDLIQSVRPDGTLLYVNRAWHETLGYSEAEIPGLSLMRDIVHPSSVPHCTEMFQRVLAGDSLDGVEAVFRTKDGRVIVLEGNCNCHFMNGQPAYTRQIFRDVTARKQAEEELKKLSSAVKQTTNCVLITDRNGVIEYVNPAFERTTGYAREEVIGKTPRLLKSGQHDQKYYETLWSTVLAGETFFAEFVNRKKSGELYHSEQSVSPIRDTHGQITHFVSTGRDITERKRAEEALKLFRALVDQSNDTIEILDPETGRFLDVNEKGHLALGYSREEFLALSIFDVDPTVDQSTFPGAVEELRKSGVLMWEGNHRRKDGSAFPVEVNLRYVQLDRDYVVAVVRDITERKRAAEQIQQQLDELRRWQAVKLGREDRNMKLKREVNELLRRLGEPIRYPSQEGAGAADPET